MTKVLFLPFSIVGGFLAGKLATFAFKRIWRMVDDQQSPRPRQRRVEWSKLLAALALEGAIFRVVRGVFDRGTRKLFTHLTGIWPGEEAPKHA